MDKVKPTYVCFDYIKKIAGEEKRTKICIPTADAKTQIDKEMQIELANKLFNSEPITCFIPLKQPPNQKLGEEE